MSIVKCSVCNTRIGEGKKYCPHCGAPVKTASDDARSEMLISAPRKKKLYSSRHLTFDVITSRGEKLCTIAPGEGMVKIPVDQIIEIYAIPTYGLDFIRKRRKTNSVYVKPGKTSFIMFGTYRYFLKLRIKTMLMNISEPNGGKVKK